MSVEEKRAGETAADADLPDRERREALRAMARFGAYVAPAMTVLVSGAEAFHPTRGHCAQDPTIKGCSTL